MANPVVGLALILLAALTSLTTHAESIAVQIKGFDDGVRTTQQQDYKEAVLFAKREAIERAGVSIKSMTTIEDFQVQSDYIESQAEAVLLPGYAVLDIGYQEDGTYLVVLTGEVSPAEEPSSIVAALTALSLAPEEFVWDIGRYGEHAIEKAYFADSGTFLIHYAWNNGVLTLKDLDRGSMLLSGSYSTSSDKGTIRLDFNEDGTAEGEWRNLLARGKITIRRR